jgi:hypothetical protein
MHITAFLHGRSAAKGLILPLKLVLSSAWGAMSETEVGRSDGTTLLHAWLRPPRRMPPELILRSSTAQKNAP